MFAYLWRINLAHGELILPIECPRPGAGATGEAGSAAPFAQTVRG